MTSVSANSKPPEAIFPPRTASERVLLEIDEPDWNHNSGRIAFGSDGFLYWTVGNGGAFHDVGDVARADAGILAGLQGRRTSLLRHRRHHCVLEIRQTELSRPLPASRLKVADLEMTQHLLHAASASGFDACLRTK